MLHKQPAFDRMIKHWTAYLQAGLKTKIVFFNFHINSNINTISREQRKQNWCNLFMRPDFSLRSYSSSLDWADP